MLSPNKNKKIKILIAVFAFLAIGGVLFFGNVENTHAADILGRCFAYEDATHPLPLGEFNITEENCKKMCSDEGYTTINPANCSWTSNDSTAKEALNNLNVVKDENTFCNIRWEDSILSAFLKCLLMPVLKIIGWLLSAAISIFTWAVDVNVFNAILANNGAIYKTWQTVRDFFNIAFILVLLFSAFATIFQIEKYNYKKILLMVVLMALLVNFSFPIARFVIDVSNSLMYTLIKGLGIDPSGATGVAANSALASSNIFARFAEYADVNKILGGNPNGDIASLLAAIIFLFILMMTFMAMAVLFLIRVVALAIIVIFSPIAFVGAILPNSLGSGKWWDYLFKYSFFGPAMIFMIFVAQKMMTATSETYLPILQAAQTNTTAGNLVAPMATFAIPIVILWIGMGVAQKMSIAGAGAVMGFAQKVIKGAGKKFSGYNAVKRQYDAYAGARKKRDEEKNKKKLGAKFGDKINDAQDKLFAHGDPKSKAGKRYNKRKDTQNKEDIKDASENYNGTSEATLHTDIKTMNTAAITAMDDNAVKDAAGKVKQALSRGALYEKEIERDLKTLVAGTMGLSGAVKPPSPVTIPVTTGMSADDITRNQAIEKQAKDKLDAWIRDEKAASMAQSRAVIKEAEDRNKIT